MLVHQSGAYSKAYHKVLAQQVKTSTRIYGLDSLIFFPVSEFDGLMMGQGDLKYNTNPDLKIEVLAPELKDFFSYSDQSVMQHWNEDDEVFAYVMADVPVYSKIIFKEIKYLSSFTVGNRLLLVDPMSGSSINKLTLVPSTSYPISPEVIEDLTAIDATETNDPGIIDTLDTKEVTSPVSSSTNYSKPLVD
jgi:hypothetical protein